MSINLPPPPDTQNHKLTDQDGSMSRVYSNWFFNVYTILLQAINAAGNQSTYIVNTAPVGLPNAQVLASLSSGFAKVTTSTGLISTVSTINESDVNNLVTDLANLNGLKAPLNAPLFTNEITNTTVGAGISIKEGSNARMGTAVLNGTTAVTISTTAVASNSRIFLTIQASGGTVGSPYVDTRTGGTSFNIKSTNAADTSTVAWLIVNPA